MEYSKTTLYVIPPSNTLPSSGSTNDLAAGQFGIFGSSYQTVNAGTIAGNAWALLAQGRNVELPGTGTKKSGKIYPANVTSWYKVEAHESAALQITKISDFSAQCGEDVTVSVRVRSKQLDIGYYNGLTRSWTISTPCCDCGDNPCTDVDDEALIDEFVTKINADELTNPFITASKVEPTTDVFELWITGVAQPAENTFSNPSANQFWFDRVNFWAFAYKGPEVSQDPMYWTECEAFATVTDLQESTYLRGTPEEIKLMEIQYHSYNTHPIDRALSQMDIYNTSFASQVDTTTFYDTYYIEFIDKEDYAYNPAVSQSSRVILAVPTGEGATIEAILNAYLGTAVDSTGSTATTTTTTTV